MTTTTRQLLLLPLVALILSGCGLRFGRAFGGNGPTSRLRLTAVATQAPPTPLPTNTPVPTATAAPTATPSLGVIGLPSESAGNAILDFTADLCKAEWSAGSAPVNCAGADPATTAGYVGQISGLDQGVPSSLEVLVMYPPQKNADIISGIYPAFTVKKGDRFRAVLGCRAHNFCDVEFSLDYYTPDGRTTLKRWTYLFTDPEIDVDYPLDGIAGMTVRFGLSVRRHGEGLQDYAVWLDPHIYRP